MTIEYGIFAPVMGLREDVPSMLLADAYHSDSQDVIIHQGEVHRAQGRTKELVDGAGDLVVPAAGPEVLLYYWYVTYAGVTKLMAFTSYAVYYWSGTAWTLVWDCSDSITHWSVCTFKDEVVMCNNTDKIYRWDGTLGGSSPELVGGETGIPLASGVLTAAKFCWNFEGHLILGYTTKSVEGLDPHDITWSDHNEWDFDAGDAGSAIVGGDGRLSGFGRFQDFLILFKERSTHRLWLTESELVFNKSEMSASIGTYSPGSIVNGIDGALYFYSSDKKFRKIDGRIGTMPVLSGPIEKQAEQIPDNYQHLIHGHLVYKYRQLWWALPGPDSTTNDRVMVMDEEGRWFRHNLAISAMSRYQRTAGANAYRIDTIPFDTIDEIGWETIDDVVIQPGYLLDICSDYSGNTYTMHSGDTDAGTSISGYVVLTTDLTSNQKPSVYKRLLRIRPFFRAEDTASTVTIQVKRGWEASWQSVGTVSLQSELMRDSNTVNYVEGDLPCDLRAKYFQIKVSGSGRWRLIGMLFNYVEAGDRE